MARLGPVQLAGLGAAGTFSIVVLAVVLRAPLPEDADAEAAPPPTATASTGDPMPLLGGPARTASSAPVRNSGGVAAPISAGGASPEARETWTRLNKEIGAGRFKDAVASLDALLEQDPNAARDRDVRSAIVELSQRIMLVDGDAPDRMFEIVTTKMGTTGIDVLYELMTTRGGSKAAARATALLADESIRARGTAAMRIAYDLYATKKCDDKRGLFSRAGEEGDNRALGQLALLNRSCGRRQTCCYHNDAELKAAMEAIKNR